MMGVGLVFVILFLLWSAYHMVLEVQYDDSKWITCLRIIAAFFMVFGAMRLALVG